MLKLSGLRKR